MLRLNASRALFSDVIPDAPQMTGQRPAFIFDSTNQWGCNSNFSIASQVANVRSATGNGTFYIVREVTPVPCRAIDVMLHNTVLHARHHVCTWVYIYMPVVCKIMLWHERC